MKKYSVFLRSAFDGMSKSGKTPDAVIVNPEDFNDVVESVIETGLNLVVIEDSEVHPGRISLMAGTIKPSN